MNDFYYCTAASAINIFFLLDFITEIGNRPDSNPIVAKPTFPTNINRD